MQHAKEVHKLNSIAFVEMCEKLFLERSWRIMMEMFGSFEFAVQNQIFQHAKNKLKIYTFL